MTRSFPTAVFALLTIAVFSGHAAADETDSNEGDQSAEKNDASAGEEIHWRDDTSLARRPGSYIGGQLGYVQARAWVEANKDHDQLEFGPLHSWAAVFRVGDAFADWFALGFQVQFINAKTEDEQIGVFDLLLDVSLYPWRGLGIRPSVGIGMGYGKGKNDWEFGGGGPGCLSLSVLYEFRVTKSFTLAPVAQVFWITGGEFDGLFIFFGIDFTKWFKTATS